MRLLTFVIGLLFLSGSNPEITYTTNLNEIVVVGSYDELSCGPRDLNFDSLGITGHPTIVKFIKDNYELARIIEYKTGVPSSVKLAQAILESGSGTSRLAKNANNYFGIKYSKNIKGVVGKYLAKEGWFSKFQNKEAGWTAHSLLLKRRYPKAFTAETTKDWFIQLKKSGYAEDPNYVNKLMFIVNKYQLENLNLKWKRKILSKH
jgi:flagellum-specific peptidoglycan hydrolase FlgJ